MQDAELSLLMVFRDFCKEHGLRWFMVGGALIGVMRHKGFIPWDDDIDIAMPRPDYDRLMELQSEFPNGYSLLNHENDNSWKFNFAQFCDDESEIIVNMNERPRKCKVWIDIFPYDGAPSGKFRRWLHVKRIMMYRHLIQIANLRTQVKTNVETRPWYEKMILKALHYLPIGKLINDEEVLMKMNRYLRKYDYETSIHGGSYLGRYREKGIMMINWFTPTVQRQFEGIMVECPHESEKLLSHFYGDYMKIPPKNRQISHYVEIVKLRNK